MRWQSVKHWIDIVIFVFIEFIYLLTWWSEFDEKKISAELWKMVIPLAKDSISAGITATSILLPSTIAIMAYLLGKNNITIHFKDSIYELYLATLFFIISLCVAIFNFTHFPIQLTENVHISFNWIIGILAITQFLSLALGIIKLFRGAYYLMKGGLIK